MATLGHVNQPDYPDYPNNDKERLDLIFEAYSKLSYSMWNSVSAITNLEMGWHLSMTELHRFENLIIGSGLVDNKADGYYQAIKLKANGRNILAEFGSYSKYNESLDQQGKIDEEKENLRTKNLELHNKTLELEIKTKDLTRDLKEAQYKVADLQAKEIKAKWRFALWVAVITIVLSQLVEHAKDIWKLLIH